MFRFSVYKYNKLIMFPLINKTVQILRISSFPYSVSDGEVFSVELRNIMMYR